MNKEYKLSSESACVYNNEVYFIPREIPILCKWNIKNNYFDIISRVPEENGMIDRLFNGMCIVDNQLFLTPYNAKKIWIFNLEELKWTNLSLDKVCQTALEGKFVGCKSYKNNIYLFGYNCKNIVKIDSIAKKMKKITVKNSDDCGCFWGQSTAMLGSKMYVPNLKTKGVCEIDLKTDSAEYKDIIEGCSFCGISNNEDSVYFLPYSGNMLYRIKNDKKEIINLPCSYNSNSNIFNGIAVSLDSIVLFSPHNKSLIIKNENNEYIDDGYNRFTFYTDIGFVVSRQGRLELFDSSMNLLNDVSLTVSRELYLKYIQCDGIISDIYYEKEGLGLIELLNLIDGE